jgi:hypothetical protein
VILVAGLPGAGKTTFLARVYAEGARLAQGGEVHISFPYISVEGAQEEGSLAYVQERWNWIQRHLDERFKTNREVPVLMDVTYRGKTSRFVTYDVPGEVFDSTLKKEESEIEMGEVDRIKHFLRDQTTANKLDAAIIVVNAKKLLSEEGHKSANLIADFVTAVAAGDFGAKDLPIQVVVTHARSTDVDATRLRNKMFGSSRSGGKKGAGSRIYRDISIFCIDTLSDLQRDAKTGRYEIPSGTTTMAGGTIAVAAVGGENWISSVQAILTDLMLKLQRRQRRHGMRLAFWTAAGVGAVALGLFTADVFAYRHAVRDPSLASLERYMNRSGLWLFNRHRDDAGTQWAKLQVEEFKRIQKGNLENALGVADEYYREAEKSPHAFYLQANTDWRELARTAKDEVDNLVRLQREKQERWKELARQSWQAFTNDFDQSQPQFRRLTALDTQVRAYRDSLQREYRAEQGTLKSQAAQVNTVDNLQGLGGVVKSAEALPCQFNDNQPLFTAFYDALIGKLWTFHEQNYELALEMFQQVRKNPNLSAVVARQLDERMETLIRRRDAIVADWAATEKKGDELKKTSWKEALALYKTKAREYAPVKRISDQLNNRIKDLDKDITSGDEALKAAMEDFNKQRTDVDKQMEALKRALVSPQLGPEHRKHIGDLLAGVDSQKNELQQLYTEASHQYNAFRTNRPLLPKVAASIDKFMDRMRAQGRDSAPPWSDDLAKKQKEVQSERVKDDGLMTDARTFLAAVKIEVSAQCPESFKAAGERIRAAVGTYRDTEAQGLLSEWSSKLTTCVEGTLLTAGVREGFKVALSVLQVLDEFAPAKREYVIKEIAEVNKRWEAFEWRRTEIAVRQAADNVQFREALAVIDRYRKDKDSFVKRDGDAEKLRARIITEWNSKYVEDLRQVEVAVRDVKEFDNKKALIENPGLPPEEMRSAELRELTDAKWGGICKSYDRLLYAAVVELQRRLDKGIVQRWDELAKIETACKAYVEDKRVPDIAKLNSTAVRELQVKLAQLREPTRVRLTRMVAWGSRKNIDSLYWIGGGYFAPSVQFNKDVVFNLTEVRKGRDITLGAVYGWKEAYSVDQSTDAGMGEGEVWTDEFPMQRPILISKGDKLTISLYSVDDAKKLAEDRLLLFREIDFNEFTPGFFVAHPDFRFEGAMHSQQNPKLRDGRAGVMMNVTVDKEDRWKL